MKEIRKTVFVAFDGKEFDRREDCARYEVESSPEAKERRVCAILSELNRLKHSHYHECFSERQKMMVKAKVDLLAAAKGKRRYLYRFAKKIERAAVEYVVAYDYWRSGLRRHRELIDELRRLAPKFDKRKAARK